MKEKRPYRCQINCSKRSIGAIHLEAISALPV